MKIISIGLDIGGANTKAVLLKNEKVRRHWFRYLPLWREKGRLKSYLREIAESHPDVVGATLTAELCDVFKDKREGVIEIVKTVCDAFADSNVLFISLDGELLSEEQSFNNPLKIAAANWVASAVVIGKRYPNSLLIDVGSTTSDIIPIMDGKPPFGRTDFERLKRGELLYTGLLRTPLPCVCSEIEIGGGNVGVASEYFSIMADVYRVLGMISLNEYMCETPDGRGKDMKSCMRRIARVFCSDLEEVGEKFVVEVAKIFHRKQVALLANSIRSVISNMPQGIDVILTGVGGRTLGKRAVKACGLRRTVDLEKIYGKEAALMTPAFCMGLLVGERGSGRCY